LGTHASNTAIDYNRELGDLWEAVGEILTQLEDTQRLNDLVLHLANTISIGEDRFTIIGSDSLSTQEAIDDWLRERERNIVNFSDTKINNAMGDLLEYLENERKNEKEKLEQMKNNYWKIWKRLA
jgi:hypothetical protein